MDTLARARGFYCVVFPRGWRLESANCFEKNFGECMLRGGGSLKRQAEGPPERESTLRAEGIAERGKVQGGMAIN